MPSPLPREMIGDVSAEHVSIGLPEALLRRIPGRARPRREVLAEISAELADRRRRFRHPVLADFLLPKVEDLYRWRVLLDCGCTHEDYTTGQDRFPDQIPHHDPVGEAPLPPGEVFCHTEHHVPKHYRDIVDWAERTVHEFPGDPEEDPYGLDAEIWATIRRAEPHSSAFWKVKLACGHHTQVCTSTDWQPSDGPTLVTEERAAQMTAELEHLWAAEPDDRPQVIIERDHLRRRLQACWPCPPPEEDCFACTRARRIVGYQRIGWLVPRTPPAPPEPAPRPSRQALQTRLRKAEAEATRLRAELDLLD